MLNLDEKRFFLYKHVSSFIPQDASEKSSKEKTLKLLEEYQNCFERDNMPGHITGSAVLVDEEMQNVLLTHHKKIGKWLQFGGHSDGEANPFNVALRETIEESGIVDVFFLYPYSGIFDIDVHEIPEYKGMQEHFHYDIRILLVTANKDFIASDESVELKWIEINEVEKYNSQKEFMRLINKVKRIKHPDK
jgi:8-oxo-dGTP pyrophosphatase MutT (NUDIX family)